MNLFEKASKEKFRYPSSIGQLTTEQLWDLPLLAKRATLSDLDQVAQALSVSIRELPEESFVRKGSNAARQRLEDCLEVVKHIIAHKQAEIVASEEREVKAERKKQLLAILEKRQLESLENLSEEEIKKLLTD